MNLYKLVPLFDRYTGEKTDQNDKLCDGTICDLCGVELDADFDEENAPYVSFEIHDLTGCEPYYHEDRLKFNASEALELFDIDWDDDIEVDNYELFNDNPFAYCRSRTCLETILRDALVDNVDGEIWLQDTMMKARLKMIDRVLRQKLFTPERLGIGFE